MRRQPTTILFICTGNTCRSPIAEGLFNKLAAKNSIKARAISAGTMAFIGSAAAENSIEVMASKNVDLSQHIARIANQAILEEADLILAMAKSHLDNLPIKYRNKAFLLSSYASNTDEDVFDPIGSDLQTYQECADLIEHHIGNLIEKISK